MSLDKTDVATIREVIFDAFEAVLFPRFEQQDERFDAQDKRFDAQEKRFDRLETDIAEIKQDVHILKDDMREVKTTLNHLDGRLEALEADVKELYGMLAAMQKLSATDKQFAKLSFEQKIVRTYQDVLVLAKESGIILPR